MTIYIWVLVEVSVVLAKLKLNDDLRNLIHDKIQHIFPKPFRRDVIFYLYFQTRAKSEKCSNTTFQHYYIFSRQAA